MQNHYFSDEFAENKVVRRKRNLVTMVARMDKWWLILHKSAWVAFISVILSGCSRTDRSIDNKGNDTLEKLRMVDSNEVDTYAAAYVYMDFDSDSLLLQNEDFDNLVPRFLAKGKPLKVGGYPGDDCSSKFRQFALNDSLLTVYKYNCGDYGFGNSQYLVGHDSIQKARIYEARWNVSSKKFELDITEQIYLWDDNQLTVRERHKVVHDYVDLDLRGIPFKLKIVGIKEYRDLIKEYRQLIE
jgi:hypothetical protein